MSIRPGRFLRQVSRHMRREKRLSLGSFLVLAIVLVLIDIFWIASINLNSHYEKLLQSVRMELFLSETLPDSLLPVMEDALIEMEGIDSIAYISKSDAARILENDLGANILDGLELNPLPRSFVIQFNRTFKLNELDGLSNRLLKLTGVEAVEYGRPWIEKVEHVGDSIRTAGYSFGVLILFVVLLTMANTNRLTARSKSQDLFQLRLLGAGPSYLLYPFLVEGFLSGLLAAALGWITIFYLADRITFSAFTMILPGLNDLVVYSFVAGFTGLIGAYLGIRRFLIS